MQYLSLALLLLFLQQSLIHNSSTGCLPRENKPLHLVIAEGYVGTKEITGKNDGPEVEMFLKSVGRKKGDSWCAAFVSYCLMKAKVKEPKTRSGLARAFILKNSIKANDVLIGKVKIPGGSIIIWQRGNTVFGHTGFVKNWNRRNGTTIEGNTGGGISGSQSEGDGVYKKRRTIMPGNYFRITSFTLVQY